MPLTFPAHQVVVLPLKRRWPTWFDGTALCLAAAGPDLGYPVVGYASHNVIGVVAFVVPLTCLLCGLLRWRAAAGVFAQAPDLGSLRLHSYRVLGRRRPAWWVTVTSALVGGFSHVALDLFTHEDRWGARVLGWDRIAIGDSPIGPIPWAQLVQFGGHTVGSAIGVWMFWRIGRLRLLEAWYGEDAVRDARTFTVTWKDRIAFGTITVALTIGGVLWTMWSGGWVLFGAILGGSVGLIVAGAVTGDAPQAVESD